MTVNHPPLGVPKRKPVPVVEKTSIPPEEPPSPPESVEKLQLPQWGQRWSQFWSQSSKRKRLLLLAITILCLLALIIGLAVGLTVGKHASNLPLPTSHGGLYSGDLTYYDPGMGSCGITSTGSEPICAVSHLVFDAASVSTNPNENPLCGMKLRIRRGDKTVDVTIVDRCVGCKATDLDVSRAVFKQLADLDLGRVVVEWAWLEDAPVTV
ncbi:RlpA-like double-psi beta-barrel-protein domain-containing protein-containing protein [Aspergillus ambiguus]|uniref:RlpA-like double-psi beta-barrel domain-containing protein n=1 Tax=Aspergillus ambiguus TaxID=176160 RepID=UPI003CCD913B